MGSTESRHSVFREPDMYGVSTPEPLEQSTASMECGRKPVQASGQTSETHTGWCGSLEDTGMAVVRGAGGPSQLNPKGRRTSGGVGAVVGCSL